MKKHTLLILGLIVLFVIAYMFLAQRGYGLQNPVTGNTLPGSGGIDPSDTFGHAQA